MYINRSEFEDELCNNILPFWENLKDDKYGGFYGNVSFDLEIDKTGCKSGIAAARFLWSFSAAYNATKKLDYLEYAKHSFKFLIDKVYDYEYSGMYWMLDYKGNPVDTRKHVYEQAFGIYALSEYYKATKDSNALEMAKILFYLIEDLGYDEKNNAYKEEYTRQWKEVKNEMLSENGVIADITTNTHLHILEAYTNLYKIWNSSTLEYALTKLIYVFYNKIYNKDTKHLKVFFNKDWEEIIELESYGHDIEASWLLDEAAGVLNIEDKDINKMIIDIAYKIGEMAIDEDGAILNEKDQGEIDYTRVWWVQSEAIVGFYNAYERTKDEKFLLLIDKVWKYTKENIIDKREKSEWFWSVEKEGHPTKRDIAESWKTPYHNSRLCIEMMERIK